MSASKKGFQLRPGRSGEDANRKLGDAFLGALAGGPLSFGDAFAAAWPDLRATYHSNTGEEIIRLRAYTVVQRLAETGGVVKEGKLYRLPDKAAKETDDTDENR